MTCTNFPKTGLVANVTTHQVGDVTYLWTGVVWESITVPLKHSQLSEKDAPNAHQQYRESATVAQIQSGIYKIGTLLSVSDRADASFNIEPIGAFVVNGYDILDAGVGKVAVLDDDTGLINIEFLGAVENGDATGAVNRLTELGYAAYIPAKRYLYTETDNRFDNPTVIGAKRPSYNEDKTQLVGGSILVGTLQLKGRNPTILNVGIDHGLVEFPSTAGNALVLAHENPFTAQSIATVRDVIALGANVEDPFHAILVEGHYDTNISNIVGIKTFFGAALKNTRNNINNAIFIDNGSDSLIIKSDTTSGKASKVNASNIICEGVGTVGTETTSFGVRVSAFNSDVDEVNISNVIANDLSYPVYLDASAANAGKMSNVNLSNIVSKDTGRVILIDGGTGTGLIDDVKINMVNAKDVEFRAYESKGNIGSVTVDNFSADAKAGNTFLSSFFQVANADSFSASNISLPVDGDMLTLGTLNLANSYVKNRLSGNNFFKLNGAGIPRDGYFEQTLTADDTVITPVFNGGNRSILRVSQSAAYSINSIVRTMTGGTRFPHGYELIIVNDSSFALTVKHNIAGWIINKGATDLVVQANDAVKYTFCGSLWSNI